MGLRCVVESRVATAGMLMHNYPLGRDNRAQEHDQEQVEIMQELARLIAAQTTEEGQAENLYCSLAIHDTITWQERHENVEESSPSARPSPATLTAAPSASHACRAMRGVQMPVFRRRRGWRPRAAITTLRPKGTFMKAGSAVHFASAEARAIHQLLYRHAVSLRFCRPVIPSSCQIVLTRRPKTTSCQHKLVTTLQLSVECPCTLSQTHTCPEKPH